MYRMSQLAAVATIATISLPVAVSQAAAPRTPDADDPAPLGIRLGPEVVTTGMSLRNGRPLVEVMLNGDGPFTLLLDTGAGVTLLGRQASERLRLESVGRTEIGDPSDAEQIDVDEVLLSRVDVGDAAFLTVPAVVLDDPAFSEHLGVDGVLGITMFRDCLLTLDYPAEEVRIEHGSLPADGDDIVPIRWGESIFEVVAGIGGDAHATHLDSGSPAGFTLPAAVVETLPLRSEPVVVGLARTINGEFEIREAQLDGSITIGDHVFEDPTVVVQDRFPFVNVGLQVLRDFAITVDQRENRLRMTRGRTSPPTSPAVARAEHATPRRRVASASGGEPPRLGLMAVPADGGLRVMGTVPGLPAETAGLLAGDTVTAVNGKAVEAYPKDELGAALRSLPLTLTLERDGEVLSVVVEPR